MHAAIAGTNALGSASWPEAMGGDGGRRSLSLVMVGGGGACGAATATVGAASTVTPSAVEAAAAVPRVEAREACTVVTVTAMEGGMSMVAVMITLPGATLIVTREASTPAAVAMPCCKLEVFE